MMFAFISSTALHDYSYSPKERTIKDLKSCTGHTVKLQHHVTHRLTVFFSQAFIVKEVAVVAWILFHECHNSC